MGSKLIVTNTRNIRSTAALRRALLAATVAVADASRAMDRFGEAIEIHCPEYQREPMLSPLIQGPTYGPRRKRGKGNKYHNRF